MKNKLITIIGSLIAIFVVGVFVSAQTIGPGATWFFSRGLLRPIQTVTQVLIGGSTTTTGSSLEVYGDAYVSSTLTTGEVCLDSDCISDWSEIQGTNYWSDDGTYLSPATSTRVVSSTNAVFGNTTTTNLYSENGVNISKYATYKKDGSTILNASSSNFGLFAGFGAGRLVGSTGYWNTALGHEALYSATSSDYNTAIGYQALYSNVGNFNSGLGYASLRSNTTGNGNFGTGPMTLYSNTTGNYNYAGGYQTLYYNTTGNSNVGLGYNALYYNNTGTNNISLGFQSLYRNRIGSYNIAIGNQSLFNAPSSSYNFAAGFQALNLLTVGNGNLALGYKAGNAITNGSNNVLLGYEVDAANTASNATAIGYASYAASNATAIGASTVATGTGSVAIGVSSYAEGDYSAVLAGINSTTTGDYSYISGGYRNLVSGMYSGIGGGQYNNNAGIRSGISSGQYNTIGSGATDSFIAGSSYSSILSGSSNSHLSGTSYSQILGVNSLIIGGIGGYASGTYIGIFNSVNTTSTGSLSSAFSSINSTASGDRSFVLSSDSVSASGLGASVIVGLNCSANGYGSSIINSNNCSANGYGSSMFSSQYTSVNATGSMAFGSIGSAVNGYGASVYNTLSVTNSSDLSMVLDSQYSIISSTAAFSFMANASNTAIYSPRSVVIGGDDNVMSGAYSMILGGQRNAVSGMFSYAMGSDMTVSSPNSFGINLSPYYAPVPATLSQSNTMAIMGGNVGIGTTTPNYPLVVDGETHLEDATVGVLKVVSSGYDDSLLNNSNIFFVNSDDPTGQVGSFFYEPNQNTFYLMSFDSGFGLQTSTTLGIYAGTNIVGATDITGATSITGDLTLTGELNVSNPEYTGDGTKSLNSFTGNFNGEMTSSSFSHLLNLSMNNENDFTGGAAGVILNSRTLQVDGIRTGTIDGYAVSNEDHMNVINTTGNNTATYAGEQDLTIIQHANSSVFNNSSIASTTATINFINVGNYSGVTSNLANYVGSGTVIEYNYPLEIAINSTASGADQVYDIGLYIVNIDSAPGATRYGIRDDSTADWWLNSGDKYIIFRDADLKIGSDDDGHLDLFADTSIDLNAPVNINSLTVTGSTTLAYPLSIGGPSIYSLNFTWQTSTIDFPMISGLASSSAVFGSDIKAVGIDQRLGIFDVAESYFSLSALDFSETFNLMFDVVNAVLNFSGAKIYQWFDYDTGETEVFIIDAENLDVYIPSIPSCGVLGTDANGKIICND